MNVIITYDIVEDKTRNKLHKFLSNMGFNIQKSVFECEITEDELIDIKRFCKRILDLERDSLRIYRICSSCLEKAKVQGTTIKLKPETWKIL